MAKDAKFQHDLFQLQLMDTEMKIKKKKKQGSFCELIVVLRWQDNLWLMRSVIACKAICCCLELSRKQQQQQQVLLECKIYLETN